MAYFSRFFGRTPIGRPTASPAGSTSLCTTTIQDRGYRLVFSSPPTDYEQWIIASKGGSNEIIGLCNQLLRGKGTFVDVGANIGSVSAPVALAGHNVIAIEMIPENCLKLYQMAQANWFTNLEIIHAAASDTVGLASYTGYEAWGEISLDGNVGHVVRLTLDGILLHRTSIYDGDFVIKIDVEGHELSVLRGLHETIAKYRPFIIFEAKDTDELAEIARESKRELERARYDLYLIRNDILVPRNSDELQEGLVSDFLAVPQEAADRLALLPNQVRELTEPERQQWIAEMASSDSEPHRKHARKFNDST